MSKKCPKSDEVQQPIQRVPIFDEAFRQDIAWWFRTDAAKAKKILDLVSDVLRDPFRGIGKPEPIKSMDSDTWSRRIDLEHRLVYRVKQERIDFLACRYHYQ